MNAVRTTPSPYEEIGIVLPSKLAPFARRTPVILAAALLILAPFSATGLRDAATGLAATDASIRVPFAYVVLSPLTRLLDALSLLTVAEHIALIASVLCLAIVAGWIAARRCQGATVREGVVRHLFCGWRALRFTALILLATVGLYAFGTLVPRPMAAIHLHDDELLAVDFHSHTETSWDNRKGWDAHDNRDWHQGAGFHAAYITDHKGFAGVRAALASNPPVAGRGTVLLPGTETYAGGVHVCILGANPADSAMYDAKGGLELSRFQVINRDTDSIGDAPRAVRQVAIVATPTDLNRIPMDAAVVGIELSDASPRGLHFSALNRRALLRTADSLGIATVSGSNLHGWGRTAAAWSVMRIAGWRELTPELLDARIRSELLARGRRAVRVIERGAPIPAPDAQPTRVAEEGAWQLSSAMIGANVAWDIIAPLTWLERIAWVVWSAMFLAVRGRWRTPKRQPA